MQFGLLSAGFVSLALASRAPSAPDDCKSLGTVGFVCLTATAEDMVAIPGSDWIVVSGVLRAVNVKDRREIPLYSSDPALDHARYPACPGPLDGRELADRKVYAHGINLRPGPDGRHTLYVVHHSGRESVEIFLIDVRGETPTVTWVGCALSPAGVSGNSVAVLPNGGFALTNFLSKSLGAWSGDKGATVRTMFARGEVTGEVWEWNVGRGWSKVPGSEGAGPNGLEASPDDFHPDNLRWQRDGSLLVAGQRGTVEAVLNDCLTRNDCSGIATSVAAVDPATLEARELVHAYPSNASFAAGTTGLRIGNEIWVGSTWHGTRIARFPVK